MFTYDCTTKNTPPPKKERPTLAADIRYVRTINDATKTMQTALENTRTTLRSATTLLAVQLPGDVRRWSLMLPALQDWPCMTMASHSEDNDYHTRALAWQPSVARTALLRSLEAGPWLRARLDVAAYAHVPLGTLQEDWVIDTADVLFARRCRDDRCLLWTVDNSVPPLVGRSGGWGDGGWVADGAVTMAEVRVLVKGGQYVHADTLYSIHTANTHYTHPSHTHS